MTRQQVELLGILRDFGPLTRKAIVEILRGLHDLAGCGNVYTSDGECAKYPAGSWEPSSVGKRLCILKRLGWAECVNTDTIKMSDGWRLGYCLRNRKLWAIGYFGFQALEAKEKA